MSGCGNNDFTWSKGSCNAVPAGAVLGGADKDGSKIFVGRARHNGDLLPAKVVASRRQAYVSHGGKEIEVKDYEVLCQKTFKWESCKDGHVPCGAVEGGRTCKGEVIYVGRVTHDGSKTVGKIHKSHGCCYIPYGGKEHSYKCYEVLVYSA